VSPLAIAVVAALGAWFAMTAIVQLPWAAARSIRRFDPTGHLLPGWNFFAPKPVQGDFAVYYRSWPDYDGDDEVLEAGSEDWQELAGIEQRRIGDTVVNPGRYTRKSIFTCCMGIVKAVEHLSYDAEREPDHPPDAILMSLPYLLLAEKVTSLACESVAVQFRVDVIRYDDGVAIPNTVFRSAVHRVAEPPADRELDHVAAS
jgi:hypothetical protein